MNPADESLGKDRLKEVLREKAAEPASTILSALLDTANDWTQGAVPRDDITLVVVKITQGWGG
jgi:serine phosphatase RsbU (regulator of sigma subunit)